MAIKASAVLITGGSSGIGRELARLFAADGRPLVLVARGTSGLAQAAAELRQAHQADVTTIPADLSVPAEIDRLAERLRAGGIEIEVLVNNAGFGGGGPFARRKLADELGMIAVNVSAVTHLTRLLLPAMLERRRGRILNVGSTAGFQPGPYMAVYYATKAYVVSFSEAIADELSGSGLRVSCLAPGPTATAFAAEAGATQSRLFQGDTMTVDEVARIGYEGWKQGKPLVIAGARNRWRAFLVRLVPRAWVRKAVRDLNTPRS